MQEAAAGQRLGVGREQPDDSGSYPLTGATAATGVRSVTAKSRAEGTVRGAPNVHFWLTPLASCALLAA